MAKTTNLELTNREVLLLAALRGRVTGDDVLENLLDRCCEAAGVSEFSVPWDAAMARLQIELYGSVDIQLKAD